MNQTTTEAPQIQLSHLLKALETSAEPQTVSWISKQLPILFQANKQLAHIQELLEASVKQGDVFSYGHNRGAPTFWIHAPEEYVQQLLIERLTQDMKTESEVINSLVGLSKLKGVVSKNKLKDIFKGLVKNQQIQPHPALLGSRTKLYSTCAVNPKIYLQDALRKLSDMLNIDMVTLKSVVEEIDVEVHSPKAVKHVQEERIKDAVLPEPTAEMQESPSTESLPAEPHTDVSQLIISRLAEINPGFIKGDMVGVDELRKALDFQLDKIELDQQLLHMMEQKVLVLHRYADAEFATLELLNSFVTDGMGSYYNAISNWRK